MNNNTTKIVAGIINAIIILTIIFGTVYVAKVMNNNWYLLMWGFIWCLQYFSISDSQK